MAVECFPLHWSHFMRCQQLSEAWPIRPNSGHSCCCTAGIDLRVLRPSLPRGRSLEVGVWSFPLCTHPLGPRSGRHSHHPRRHTGAVDQRYLHHPTATSSEGNPVPFRRRSEKSSRRLGSGRTRAVVPGFTIGGGGLKRPNYRSLAGLRRMPRSIS